MSFPHAQGPGLADGRIAVTFRRWRRPSVGAGGTPRSPVGVLAIGEVTPIDPADITGAGARSAGLDEPDAVGAVLRGQAVPARLEER